MLAQHFVPFVPFNSLKYFDLNLSYTLMISANSDFFNRSLKIERLIFVDEYIQDSSINASIHATYCDLKYATICHLLFSFLQQFWVCGKVTARMRPTSISKKMNGTQASMFPLEILQRMVCFNFKQSGIPLFFDLPF